MIRTLAHVMIRVTDLERAVAFYRDVLGLKEAFRLHGDDGTVRIVYLHAGERQFVELSRGNGEPAAPALGYVHICFEVQEIRALYERLERAGCVVPNSLKQGRDQSWQFWSADPDGNRIEFMEYTPESKQAPFLPGSL